MLLHRRIISLHPGKILWLRQQNGARKNGEENFAAWCWEDADVVFLPIGTELSHLPHRDETWIPYQFTLWKSGKKWCSGYQDGPAWLSSAISKNVPTKKETAAEPKPGCRNDEPCAKLRSRQIRQVWNRLFQSCPYTCPVGTTNGKFLIKSKGRIQVNDPVSFLRTECVEYGDVASQKKKTYNTGVTEYRITGMVGNR